MDIASDPNPLPEYSTLSYDDTVPYEDQVPTDSPIDEPAHTSLANRIGNTKVYLLSESSIARVGKVRSGQ
jgi:hypothetical protein